MYHCAKNHVNMSAQLSVYKIYMYMYFSVFPPPSNLNAHAHAENTVWFMRLHKICHTYKKTGVY